MELGEASEGGAIEGGSWCVNLTADVETDAATRHAKIGLSSPHPGSQGLASTNRQNRPRGEGPWLEPARQRSDSRATYEAKLAAPSAVTEAEFTPRLLDDLFRRHCGRGEAQLEIGGRLVRRIPRKVVDPEQGMLFGIFFEWISDGGEVRQLSVTSKQSGIWPN